MASLTANDVGEHLAGITPEELTAGLANPQWRLRNLYWIIDRFGKKVLFVPNEVQEQFYRDLWWKNLILKARQRGFSTATQILELDTCLFQDNTAAAVIAQDEDSAVKIFRKVRFAYDNLPPIVLSRRPLARDAAAEIILANGSTLGVTTSARSTTLQMLHISEFGIICATRPDRAREIVAGSLPAAQQGVIVIESTGEGREGAYFEMLQRAHAAKQEGRQLSRLDYRFHFASWYDDPAYVAEPTKISPVDTDYFNRMESLIGQELSPERRSWYVGTRDNELAGDWQVMKSQYPTTPEEAFEESVEGLYLGEQMAAARRTGRITDVPYDPRVPVNTFWDLGMDDDMVIWFHQRVDGWDNWIDYYECHEQTWSFYVQHLQSTGYVWGKHYLPHDADQRRMDIFEFKTAKDMLYDLGLRNMITVPRTPNLMTGIRQLRDAFPRYRFDRTHTKQGVHHLDRYRRGWNDRLGAWADHPVKNGHQHAADAIRQHAQSYQPAVENTRDLRRRRVSGVVV